MRKFQTFFLLIFLVACSPAKNLQLVEFDDYEFDCSDVSPSEMYSLQLSEEFDVDSWVCSIRAINSPVLQQTWYSNLLGILSLQEGPIDVNLWHTLINELTSPVLQQTWYSNLLGALNLQAINGDDVDLDVMYLLVDELTNETLQKTWKANIESTKALRLLNKVSG